MLTTIGYQLSDPMLHIAALAGIGLNLASGLIAKSSICISSIGISICPLPVTSPSLESRQAAHVPLGGPRVGKREFYPRFL